MKLSIKKIVGNVFWGLLLIFLILSLIGNFNARKDKYGIPCVFGLSSMTVLSGSMSPVFEPGDLIIINRKEPQVNIGDIITYSDNNSFVTHRIVDIKGEGGQASYICQGDANNVEDLKPIYSDQIVGKYLFHMPFGGYVSRFIRTPMGIIFILCILGSIKLLQISIKEVKKNMKSKENENTTTQ